MSQQIGRAIDVGYGYTKYTTSSFNERGAVSVASFPSLTTIYRGASSGMSAGLQHNNVVHIPVNGTTYVAGKDVQNTMGPWVARVLDQQYATTDHYLSLARAAMFYMSVPRINMLVVGLPSSTLAQHRDTLVKRLTGEHRVVRPAAGSVAEQQVKIQVDKVVVLPQPVGGYIDFAGSVGNLAKLDNRYTLLVDPGYYTLDWVVCRGMCAVESRCGSAEGGMSSVFAAMMEEVERELGQSIGRAHHQIIDDAIRANIAPSFYGREFDMSGLLPKGRLRAEELLREVVNGVGDSADIDKIILVGGGANFFLELVKAKFPRHQVTMIANPEFANVRGFQRRADTKTAGDSTAK
jgi:plasmid segregation protein ParM